MTIKATNRQLHPDPRDASRPRLGRACLITSIALFASIAIGGCGGGGGGGFSDSEPDPNGGTSLNARVLWQQRAAGHGTARYAASLPAAVRAVRIGFTFADGTQCCVSVDPRHEAFANSQSGLIIDNLAPGSAVLEIAGFTTPIAPAEGVDLLCGVTPLKLEMPAPATPTAPRASARTPLQSRWSEDPDGT
jgi:hypothetical protein